MVSLRIFGDELGLEAVSSMLGSNPDSSYFKDDPVLQEFILVAQNVPQLELFRRGNAWRPEHFFLEDAVTFESAGLSLPVKQIYRRVTF